MAERSLIEKITRAAGVVLIGSPAVVACAPQPPAQVKSIEVPPSPVVPIPEAKVAATTVAAAVATPEATQPPATATVKPIDTATATAKPTTEPTKEPTAVPEKMPLPEYGIYGGFLVREGSQKREGVVLISRLPDLPNQKNKILVYYVVGNSYNVILFDPQNIQKTSFEGGLLDPRSGKMSESTKLTATLNSSTALSGQLKLAWAPELKFDTTLKGSGQKPLLDEAVRLYLLQFQDGSNATMNPNRMLEFFTRVNVILP